MTDLDPVPDGTTPRLRVIDGELGTPALSSHRRIQFIPLEAVETPGGTDEGGSCAPGEVGGGRPVLRLVHDAGDAPPAVADPRMALTRGPGPWPVALERRRAWPTEVPRSVVGGGRPEDYRTFARLQCRHCDEPASLHVLDRIAGRARVSCPVCWRMWEEPIRADEAEARLRGLIGDEEPADIFWGPS